MKEKKINLLVLTALIIYTAIMIYFMLFGFGRGTQSGYLYNFVPFKQLYRSFNVYIWYNFRHFVVNIIGNIVMFIPFGIFLTILFKGRLKKALIAFIIGIVTLETAQLILRRGVFDVDDILLNSTGFLLGYATIKLIKLINKLISKFRKKRLK